MTIQTFDYKCEECKQKKVTLYLNQLDKKWYCKDHSPYFNDRRSTSSSMLNKSHHGAYRHK